MKIKRILITYTILIILTFIPGVSEALFMREEINLFEFLTPVLAFNFIFTMLNAFTSNKEKEEDEEFPGQKRLVEGLVIILIHIPVILLEVIPTPLNALLFSLFTIAIISIP